MSVGDLIKSLRAERQLTQKELAKDITTRTTLASIENRNSDISIRLLLKLLDRLNVRLEEFVFLLNEGNYTEKQQIYFAAYSDYYSKDVLSQKLESKLLTAYAETKDFFYLAVFTQMLGIKKKNNPLTSIELHLLEKNSKLIISYLNDVTNWNHFEFALFTNCLFLFENSYIQVTYKRVKKNYFK